MFYKDIFHILQTSLDHRRLCFFYTYPCNIDSDDGY